MTDIANNPFPSARSTPMRRIHPFLMSHCGAPFLCQGIDLRGDLLFQLEGRLPSAERRGLAPARPWPR